MDILRMSSDEGDPCVRKFLASASELQDQTDPAKTFHNARGWLIKKYVYDGRDILTLWCVISESASRGAQDGYPYDVTVTRKENEGFGFVIISSVTRAGSVIDEKSNLTFQSSDWVMNQRRPHPWIGKIIDGSPAERCGGLHVGDRILAVNGTEINHMHHEEIVNLIKLSGYSVTLTIGPPQADDTSSTGSNPPVIRNSHSTIISPLAYPTQSDSDLSRRSEYSPYHSPVYPASNKQNNKYPYQPVLDKQRDIQRQKAMSTQPNVDSEEDKYIIVELHRGSRGFGFSIRGGKEFNNMPLYVLRIAEGGAADLDNRIKVGDQIIEINGYNTNNMTHSEAINLIASGGSTVKLLVKRTGKPPPAVAASSTAPGGQAVRPPSSNPSPLPSMPNGPIRALGQGSPNQASLAMNRLETKSPYLYNSSSHYDNHLGPGRPNSGY
ncbi:hypothetical protein LSH36_403g02016 [Paralvinella palmiformis]|uniref:PDZ domain-containing protein n=1 Tax=Paralvinella palmiformis TaxID=53620 RepID=A0AAD9N182_9ANNE|nr:hypothetical protein LSH36_403g02016 [Paralvinella palmiformis]